MIADNLIIVGKNSYIGGYFTKYAKLRSAEVISLSSKDCNFLDPNAVGNLFGSLGNKFYTVIFLAVVNKSTANSFQSYIENVRLVKNFIDGYKYSNIKSIVYLSSVDIYGMQSILPITERSKIDPDSWYALGKYSCEWMLTFSGDVNCPVTILRIPGIYGHSHNDKSVIGRIALSIKSEDRVTINGSGQTLRDYVYIDDLCKILELLIPLRYQGVLNVATGESLPILEIAKLVGSVLGMEFKIAYQVADPKRDFDLTFDIQSLSSLIPDFRFSDMTTGISTYA